jgi:hypothetical protein
MYFMLGDPILVTPFTAFTDTVSSDYSTPGLCALVYFLSQPESTTFGLYLSGMNINFATGNSSLMGQSALITLSAHATPQQTAANPTVQFTVYITDPCPLTAI